MKGRYWNHKENKPEPELIKFLEEKVDSTSKRIKEATDIDVQPIYYSAGYKDGNKAQNPYNLSKLMLLILQHTKEEKRAVFVQDINKDSNMWKDDDRLKDYRGEIQKTLWDSVKESASQGADIGGAIFGAPGRIIGGAIGAIGGFIGGLFGEW
jgi:predicted GTPase